MPTKYIRKTNRLRDYNIMDYLWVAEMLKLGHRKSSIMRETKINSHAYEKIHKDYNWMQRKVRTRNNINLPTGRQVL